MSTIIYLAYIIKMSLSRVLINLILEKGHSRVPVYNEHRTNIIGLVLVIISCCFSNAHQNVSLRCTYHSDKIYVIYVVHAKFQNR